MPNPVDERISALGPGGYISPSGVAELRRALAMPDVAAAYDTWRGQGMTKMVASAVFDMVTHPPVPAVSTEVQYGISLGLTMAHQLLVDPSLLFPGVFGRGPLVPPLPDLSDSDDNE